MDSEKPEQSASAKEFNLNLEFLHRTWYSIQVNSIQFYLYSAFLQ